MVLKHISRYLKSTRTKCIIMKPNIKQLHLDFFANVAFDRIFVAENKHDTVSVESRTSVLLNFRGVPILAIQISIRDIPLYNQCRVYSVIPSFKF